jgi:hypothetical protein
MNEKGQEILRGLQAVAAERAARAADPALGAAVVALKAFQHARLQATYADLLASARWARAARFFLDDLYGPMDFTQRDAQFARIVPGLVRLFPADIVSTVAALGELHALSETMDTAMGRALAGAPCDARSYPLAWRAVGQPAVRERQIALMLVVGTALDRYTRKPLLRHSLRLMRGPAAAAGLGVLQAFLENGFDTFRDMAGAEFFLDTVASRERELAARLFAGGDLGGAAPAPAPPPPAELPSPASWAGAGAARS